MRPRPLLLLVVALIVYGSLYPWQLRALPPRAWLQFWNPRDTLFDVVVNVVLYVPVGLLARAWLGRPAPAALFGAAISLGIEVAQLFIVGRESRALDVLENGAGAGVGALLAGIVPSISPQLLLLSFWAMFQLLPAFAAGHGLKRPDIPGPAVARPLMFAIEWTAAFAAAATLGQGRFAVLLVALLAPLRWLAGAGPVTPPEWIGIAAALAIVLFAGGRIRSLDRWVGIALVLLIVDQEVWPLRFGAPSAFSWVPFESVLASPWYPAFVILARKAFLYGAAIWFLGDAFTIAGAAGGLAAILLGFEWLQRWLPGRTPEVTDSVLALILGLALSWARESAPSRRRRP